MKEFELVAGKSAAFLLGNLFSGRIGKCIFLRPCVVLFSQRYSNLFIIFVLI